MKELGQLSSEARWFVIRVLLEGANEQEHGQAVEEIRAELERYEYRNARVDWQSETEGPVFRLEVEVDDSGNVALFVEDDIVELGSALLLDFDRLTVTLLDIEPLDGEWGSWLTEYAFAVSHWPAHLIAGVGVIIFGFFAVMGFVSNSPLVGILFLVAFLACAWLLVSYGKTIITHEGVTHVSLMGRYEIGWDKIESAVIDSGGNTVVLKGYAKQLVLPHFFFWAGRDKFEAQAEFLSEIERRSIPLKRGVAAFAISRNTRI